MLVFFILMLALFAMRVYSVKIQAPEFIYSQF